MYEKKTESIKFKAKAVIYEDKHGEFRIIRGIAYNEKGTESLGRCSIKGNLADVKAEDVIFAIGYWEEHPKYGRSLRVTAYVEDFPHTAENILSYLEQGNIAGVTPKRARKIVEMFGDQSFDVLQNHPERLAQIPGIGEKSIEKIAASAKEEIGERTFVKALMVYIRDFGISPAYAKKIYDTYGERSLQVLHENPYQLADDVKGIGFIQADKIALGNGVREDAPFRVDSCISYVLKSMQNEGHVYGKMEIVQALAQDYLGLELKHVADGTDRLIRNNKLIAIDSDLYLPKLYYAEKREAKNLVRLITPSRSNFSVSDQEIRTIEKAQKIKYADAQIKAIKVACSSSVTVITGGPGTGKTTIINTIIQLCRKHRLKIACAAPTGKAAKRMGEATGTKAKTIHKLLEAMYNENAQTVLFTRDASNPLEEDVIIVDESSMIDTSLFDSLLKAIKTGAKLILVGDVDQLPSVGCGNVLHEVIDSGVVPVERLSVIFRQEAQSKIIRNAHLVNAGKMPDLVNKKQGDFFFINTEGMKPEAVRDIVVKYTCENLPKYYGVAQDEVQILAPMKKGHTGVYELNNYLQEQRHPKKSNNYLTNGSTVFYEGDKVMCTSNDYENLIFNGDVGKIVKIKTEINEVDEERYFVVDFDGVVKRLPIRSARDYSLAYAMTIHKSQGSEYDIVVIPLTCQNFVMLQRNLLYTAITRAKKICVLVGEPRAIRIAVQTLTVNKRNTHLCDFIEEEAEQKIRKIS